MNKSLQSKKTFFRVVIVPSLIKFLQAALLLSLKCLIIAQSTFFLVFKVVIEFLVVFKEPG